MISVLYTYPMLVFYPDLGPAIHRLLIFILSNITRLSNPATDMKLSLFMEITGTTIRTIGNYVSRIMKIRSTTPQGEIIPLFDHCSIDYINETLEAVLSKQYVETFAQQFLYKIAIPESILDVDVSSKRKDYLIALRIAIWIADTTRTRKRIPDQFALPIDVCAESSSVRENRWRTVWFHLLVDTLDRLWNDSYIDGWRFKYEDTGYICMNKMTDEDKKRLKQLMRSWTYFTQTVRIEIDVMPEAWRKQVF